MPQRFSIFTTQSTPKVATGPPPIKVGFVWLSSYRDQKPIAIEAAEHLKRKHPRQCNRGEGFAEQQSDLSEYKPDLR